MKWASEIRALLVACLFAGPSLAQEVCDPAVADLRDADSQVQFHIEVMDDAGEREHGLMFRESLPHFSGMLFVYETPQPVAFWMRNTLIPLDMLFFDGDGRLVRIKQNALPHDETPVFGGDAIRYVLEINSGLAAELGLDIGAEIRSPALDQSSAAWPC